MSWPWNDDPPDLFGIERTYPAFFDFFPIETDFKTSHLELSFMLSPSEKDIFSHQGVRYFSDPLWGEIEPYISKLDSEVHVGAELFHLNGQFRNSLLPPFTLDEAMTSLLSIFQRQISLDIWPPNYPREPQKTQVSYFRTVWNPDGTGTYMRNPTIDQKKKLFTW